MATFAIARADGGVSIMTVPDGGKAEAAFARWMESADPSWLPATMQEIDPATVPQSRRWRAAWSFALGSLRIPLARARVLRRRELLAVRDVRLKATSGQLESAEDAADVVRVAELRARRIRLRAIETDVDAALAAASTLAEIDAVTHADL